MPGASRDSTLRGIRFDFLYISRGDLRPPSGRGFFRAAVAQAAPPVVGFPSLAFAKALAEECQPCRPIPLSGGDPLPKEGRPPLGPPAFRAGNPLGDLPWSILSIYL